MAQMLTGILYILTLYNVILRIARNFYPSILTYKFGLIFMGMKQKKFKLADSRKIKSQRAPTCCHGVSVSFK